MPFSLVAATTTAAVALQVMQLGVTLTILMERLHHGHIGRTRLSGVTFYTADGEITGFQTSLAITGDPL